MATPGERNHRATGPRPAHAPKKHGGHAPGRPYDRNLHTPESQDTFRNSPQAGPSTYNRGAPPRSGQPTGAGPSRHAGALDPEFETTYRKPLTETEHTLMLDWASKHGSHKSAWDRFAELHGNRTPGAWSSAYQRLLKKMEFEKLKAARR
ncbi:hypothetical protein PENSPDRAFT_226914 [Peniophora sp. CONT]|nr:hypothetical protein PENSPDRAFT_226914 [Peniophora sp. CONT]